jgi:alpha-L-arabinofuranosidase
VRDSNNGDLIIKLVYAGPDVKPLHIELSGAGNIDPEASKTVLSGDPMAVNSIESHQPLVPETEVITVGKSFDYNAPAHSLTVTRIKTKSL